MDLSTVIKERRSVRRYSDKTVNFEQIARLVDSARWAPTAANLQAWEFQVTVDPKKIDAIRSIAPGISRTSRAIVVISVDREKARRKGGAGGEMLGLLDACFAAENMLLTAHDLGLGACVVRSFHQGAAARLFGNPEHIVPELLVTIGYPEGSQTRGPRRRSLRELIHLEKWGNPISGQFLAQFEETNDGAVPAAGVDSDAALPVAGEGREPVGEEDGPSVATGDEGPAAGDEKLARLRETLIRHLCYLVSSARGLSWEPREYGPFRLIDACGRLIGTMEEYGLKSPRLAAARELIEEKKLSVMDDPETFNQAIDQVLDILVAEL